MCLRGPQQGKPPARTDSLEGSRKETKEALVLLSGGIDSATCLYLAREKYLVRALTFEYHGIAQREVRAARTLAESAGVEEHKVIRLPDLKEAGEIRSPRFGGLPPTYIPMRNAVFYSTAASFAEEVGAQIIIGGHNRGDRRTFADAGPRFFRDMQRALRSGAGVRTGGRVRILLPVAGLTKIEVIKLAKRRGVPLDLTWSCHRDREAHCWECEGCLSRVRTFEKAGVSDPLAPG